MVFVSKGQQQYYVPIQVQRHFVKTGQALYLPRRRIDGIGIGDLISWISRNSDNIKNVVGVASDLVGTTGKVANTTLDIIKKAKNLREKKEKGIEGEALNEIASLSEVKRGKGFYYV